MNRARTRAWLIATAVLLAALLLAACAGHEWSSPRAIVRALAGDDSLRSRLLLQWRLPRVFAAALVGALLGLSGAVFQGVFRNPLAEPYLLGASGGAALGATVALLVPLGVPQAYVLPVLAFAGAWGATALVLGVSRVAGALDAAGMLLAGGRHRGDAGRAALLPDARAVGRNREPARGSRRGSPRSRPCSRSSRATCASPVTARASIKRWRKLDGSTISSSSAC